MVTWQIMAKLPKGTKYFKQKSRIISAYVASREESPFSATFLISAKRSNLFPFESLFFSAV